MTTPIPASNDMDAPSLIGTGIQSMIHEARRLGLSWELTLGTVTDSANFQVVCDGDTTAILVTSMIGALRNGQRVYIVQVPPSGNFVMGTATIDTKGILSTAVCTAGVVAASASPANTEAAIPVASWTNSVDPSGTFINGRLFRVDAQIGVFQQGAAADSLQVVRLRKGAASTSGTVLLQWIIDSSSAAAGNVPVMTQFGYFKNTSGVDVVSDLSLTNARFSGSTTMSLFGNSGQPILIVISDVGYAADYPPLAAVAISV